MVTTYMPKAIVRTCAHEVRDRAGTKQQITNVVDNMKQMSQIHTHVFYPMQRPQTNNLSPRISVNLQTSIRFAPTFSNSVEVTTICIPGLNNSSSSHGNHI